MHARNVCVRAQITETQEHTDLGSLYICMFCIYHHVALFGMNVV